MPISPNFTLTVPPELIRKKCNCQGNKHSVVTNCINCGRIICENEFPGICLTCESFVIPTEPNEFLMTEVEYMDLPNNLQEKKSKLFAALQLKDTLLEFNRIPDGCCQVIDDNDSDEKCSTLLMSAKMNAMNGSSISTSRLLPLRLDVAGSQNARNAENTVLADPNIYKAENILSEDIADNYFISTAYHPTYLEGLPTSLTAKPSRPDKRERLRIQDADLQYMSDRGICLSVHQPFASLIMTGIREHEGSSWYTSFRGRLWIHAACKTLGDEVMVEVENFYRSKLGSTVKFPEGYRTDHLLGFVDLTDCLTQENYRLKYPDGESGSPCVLILQSPTKLIFPLPMKGKRHLFKMEKKFHQAAKKMIHH